MLRQIVEIIWEEQYQASYDKTHLVPVKKHIGARRINWNAVLFQIVRKLLHVCELNRAKEECDLV